MVVFCLQINPAARGKSTLSGVAWQHLWVNDDKKAAEAAYFLCFFVLVICLFF